jgi:23S rRNA U2552 (ribose-2'-O)-methylase RlmE/FtsJ
LLPSHIKSTEFVSGGPNQLDSVVLVNYADGAKWELRINEISDVKHTLGYQVLSTEPAHQVTSIQGRFTFRAVTDEN